MRSKYEILLKVEFDHEYYNDGSFEGLDLIPDSSTSAFMRNHKLLFKKKDKSYFILQEGFLNDGGWEPIVSVDDVIHLVFYFKFNDKLFQTKTNSQFYANKDEKAYVDNMGIVDELRVLPFKKGAIVLDNSTSHESAVFRLTLNDDEEIEEFEVGGYSKELVFPSRAGKVELQKNDEQVELFLWSVLDDQYDGFVALKIGSEIEQSFDFCFNSREIFWEYVVNLKYLSLASSGETFYLKEESNGVNFDAVNEGESELTFQTQAPVKLYKNMDYSMFLEVAGEKEFSNIGVPQLKNLNRSSKLVNKLVLVEYITV